MTFGQLFWQLFEYIAGFWPVRIIDAHEQGVRLRWGRIRGDTLLPGVHLFLPRIEAIHTGDATSTSLQCGTQTLETLDGVCVAVSCGVNYRIFNYPRMFVTIFDLDEVVGNAVGAAVTNAVTGCYYSVDDGEPAAVDFVRDSVFRELVGRFEEWGLDLEDVAILSFAPARTFRLIQD